MEWFHEYVKQPLYIIRMMRFAQWLAIQQYGENVIPIDQSVAKFMKEGEK